MNDRHPSLVERYGHADAPHERLARVRAHADRVAEGLRSSGYEFTAADALWMHWHAELHGPPLGAMAAAFGVSLTDDIDWRLSDMDERRRRVPALFDASVAREQQHDPCLMAGARCTCEGTR